VDTINHQKKKENIMSDEQSDQQKNIVDDLLAADLDLLEGAYHYERWVVDLGGPRFEGELEERIQQRKLINLIEQTFYDKVKRIIVLAEFVV